MMPIADSFNGRILTNGDTARTSIPVVNPLSPAMRIVNAILSLMMLLFIVVQYNDPDGSLWMVIYAIPATWAAIAAFQRSILSKRIATTLLALCIIAACYGVYWFWPDTPEWWKTDVWWETEVAREGMGMMIVAIVLAIVWISRQQTTSATS